MQHRLLEKNPESSTGVCKVCGPVDLFYRKDRNLFICRNSPSINRPGRKRGHEASSSGHGLTRDETEVFKAGKVCWICGGTERLVVDHCHKTGRIRGVLCGLHNIALGAFQDNQLHLERAILYLNSF